MFKYTLSLFIITLSLFSCKDKEVDIPSYIYINDIDLNITDVDQGSARHSFSDAYVFVNDILVGIYDLPALVPVLQEGRVTVKVGGGIKQNGVYSSRLEYPFYTRYETQVDLIRGQEDTIHPVVEYIKTTKFLLNETFENSISFLPGKNSDDSLSRITDPSIILEGACGGIILDSDDKQNFEFYTEPYSNIPRFNTSPVYMELDFKGNIFVNVGAYYNEKLDNEISFVLPPKDEWTKIYINLTDILGVHGGASDFNFLFAYSKGVTSFTGTAEFYIDNVKIIHY